MTALGQIFDKENVAKEKLSALDSKVAQVAKDAQSKTALLVLVNESKISAFGDGSRYGMVYQKFGFKPIDDSIKSSTHGQSVGFEYILEKIQTFYLSWIVLRRLQKKPTMHKKCWITISSNKPKRIKMDTLCTLMQPIGILRLVA